MRHDLGASSTLASYPLRFKTAGADALAELLTRHRTAEAAVGRDAWLAVALHSSAHLAGAQAG